MNFSRRQSPLSLSRYVPGILLLCALIATALAIFGDDSFSRMKGLKRSLVAQRETNNELNQHVAELNSKVNGLLNDDRTLEKAARDELGMARPNEMIFIFEKSSRNATIPAAK